MHVLLRTASLLLAASSLLNGGCSDTSNNTGGGPETPGFVAANLISDQAGVATNVDPSLVNAWGLAMDARSFWISNNGSGVISVVAPDGSPSKFSPAASVLDVGPGITGIVANPTSAFLIGPTGKRGAARMLVASETGQIFAINSDIAATPQLVIDNSSAGAIYKGITIYLASDGSPRLAATDFHNGRVDVYDSSFQPIGTVFVDPNLRTGLAPFNIAAIGNVVYVSYAIQDADRKDDVPGLGHGRISVFDLDGHFLKVLEDGNQLDAPWGMALAPAEFSSALAGSLIVGNFGNGSLIAIDPSSGLTSQLLTPSGHVLMIDGLWGLAFGDGQNVGALGSLYFTAGPQDETHGLYGRIVLGTAAPI